MLTKGVQLIKVSSRLRFPVDQGDQVTKVIIYFYQKLIPKLNQFKHKYNDITLKI